MAGSLKASEALRVHVQKIARAIPFVAADLPSGGLGDPGASVAAQHLVDGRVGVAGDARDQPRAPAGVLPDLADPLLLFGGEHARAAVRTARALRKAGERPALDGGGLEPAVPPAMGGRRRYVEGGRGRPQCHSVLDRQNECVASGKSEFRVTVPIHPGPPLVVSPRRPTASGRGPDVFQSFTRCVGTSPSRLSSRWRSRLSATSWTATRRRCRRA